MKGPHSSEFTELSGWIAIFGLFVAFVIYFPDGYNMTTFS